MNFDIQSVPFSCYGAPVACSLIENGPECFHGHIGLRSLYGLFEDQETYPLILLNNDDKWLLPRIEMTAVELIASAGDQYFKMCFHNEKTIHVMSNASLMIAKTELGGFMSDRVMHHASGVWEIAGNEGSLRIRLHHGRLINNSGWRESGKVCEKIEVFLRPDDRGILDFSLWYSGITCKEPDYRSYEEDLAQVESTYSDFSAKFATKLNWYENAMKLAAYISWHSVMLPEGYIKHPVLLVSKNIMNMVWSWDYTFNALALVDKQPKLAYDQFLAVAALQDEDGAYPDAFHARRVVRAFVKPPIQGYILEKMYKINPPNSVVRQKIYHSVADFTTWWLGYRTGEDGIPLYHHGNESGWDNGTVFKDGLPVQSPDLSTWLILQMEFLAAEAAEFGFDDEADWWKTRSDKLLQDILIRLGKDNSFMAIKMPENNQVKSESLMLFIPLLLGSKLPEAMRQQMIAELLAPGRYFTDYGFASEPIDSELFFEDGYWRGAVWPPTAYIFTDILLRNGCDEQARQNAVAYCDMCLDNGFYENYSVLDGHGLRDCGFTWSASIFMILIRDLLEE
jgi:hypothetical protein